MTARITAHSIERGAGELSSEWMWTLAALVFPLGMFTGATAKVDVRGELVGRAADVVTMTATAAPWTPTRGAR